MKRLQMFMLVGLFAVICAACQPSAPTIQPAAAAEPETYSLQDGSVIDRDGNPIEETAQFRVIYEWDTGHPQAKYLKRMEDTGVRDEYGNPVVKHLSALYDMEGNLLCDWDEVDYESGWDDYIVRREVRKMDMMEEIKPGFARGLWSLTEKRLVLPEAVTTQRFDDNSFLVSDNMGRLLGRVDRKLNPIGEFPVNESYYNASVWEEYIAVTTVDPNQWYKEESKFPTEKPIQSQTDLLLTADYQIALEKEHLFSSYYQACSKKLIMYEEKGVRALYSMLEKRDVATAETGIDFSYYDDELVMLRIDKQTPDNIDRFAYWLQTIDGTRLTEDYEKLESLRDVYSSYDAQTVADGFIGVWDNRVELLDRKGKVMVQVELPDVVSVDSIGEVGFTYTVKLRDENRNILTDEWGNTVTREGLLDHNLQVVIPAEKYQFIQPQFIGKNHKWELSGFVSGYYTLPGDRTARSDLLDTSGNLIAGQLTMIGAIGEDRIQVIKGFQEGLMNFKGEWVYKQSLFNALEDE